MLSACSGSAVGAGSAVDSTFPPADAIPQEAPQIELLAQAYQGKNIVEIPQILSEDPTETISTINLKMLDFAGDYGTFLAVLSDDVWLELKCYLLYGADSIQIILTRAEYPLEDGYGEIASFVYNYKEDRECTLEEAVRTADIDLTESENQLLLAVPEDMTILDFRPVAFAVTGAETTPNLFFYDVLVGGGGSEMNGGRMLYIRYPDGSYEAYDGGSLSPAFPDGSLLALDPPLFWAQQAEG
ncbi:MAG: hypothetical protein LBN36_08305 [Clostridiales Family XIII bacterium]|jgi:hypothetical protein|nr:hypothetical protein [Clostridiales Family XIII bacterium]